MPIHTGSQEAQAAQRFFEATRNVDRAFRAVRGDADEAESTVAYAAAMSRLDRALDELARAEAFFDSVVGGGASRRN